jgi:cytidine deaminase
MTGFAKTTNEALNRLEALLNSGHAYERFCRMVAAQGGKLAGDLPLESPHEIIATHSGFISQFDNDRIAAAITSLGGGRKRIGDPINHRVGWQIHVRIGDKVQQGQTLATLFASPNAAVPIVQQANRLFTITDTPVPARPLVLSRQTHARSPWERLAARAIEAGKGAYAPYSRYQVGAALLSSDGQIFTGCNVENASYGATICAERVAASSAIAAGRHSWQAIAIATQGGAAPCGICRQFLFEFAPQLTVLLVDSRTTQFRETSLQKLLPDGFSERDL